MPRSVSIARKRIVTILAWFVGLAMFFPILWTVLTGFKPEGQAFAFPPYFLGVDWTLDTYREVWERSDLSRFFWNSAAVSAGSTAAGLAIALPAAWAMAFAPTKRTNFLLMWMLSTKMLPAVGVLMPVYLICRDLGLLDTRFALIFLLMMGNLPIIIWMLFTYFREIPLEILESARMDGANLGAEIFYVLVPLAAPGIASTIFLNVILAWNEAFWTLLLTSSNAGTMSALIASMSSPEGLFYAKLSAASTLAIAPMMVMGWFCQKQIVRGLTFGTVK